MIDRYHMKKWLYVDNLLYTDQTEEILIQFFHNACKNFSKAHLYLKEWISNSTELQTLVSHYGVDGEIKETNKVLGLGWDIEKDRMKIMGHLSTPETVTKREVL